MLVVLIEVSKELFCSALGELTPNCKRLGIRYELVWVSTKGRCVRKLFDTLHFFFSNVLRHDYD